MSVKHPNISLWQRDAHEGSYATEVEGWALRVTWAANTRSERGSFHWEASQGDERHHGHGNFEELESAMAEAEEYARLESLKRAWYATQA